MVEVWVGIINITGDIHDLGADIEVMRDEWELEGGNS
jgi:hypothetical protein